MNVIGHSRQLAYLKKAATNGALGHAYLFEGPKHIGKMTAALEWAGAFFPQSERGLIAAGSHPDVIVCSRERHIAEKSEENETTIGIDDIHELRRLMALSTRLGSRRIAIIDGAEDMTDHAQNALLKILEEPGEGKLFILVSHDVSRLLSTILSRVVSLSFSYASDTDMEKFVEENGVLSRDKNDLLFCAGNRPGVLVRLVEDVEFRADALARKKMIALLADAPLFERMKAVAAFAGNREVEDEFFFGFFRMARERLMRAFDGNGVSHGAAAQAAGVHECATLKNALRIKRYMDTTNVNRRLALENIVLEI